MNRKEDVRLREQFLFVSDIAGFGSRLLSKMFAAQKLVPNARWVFGGGYLNSEHDNLLTINVIQNYVRQFDAVALWGPDEVLLKDFMDGKSNAWLNVGGQKTVNELLGTHRIKDVDAVRSFMNHEGMIKWLIDNLSVIADFQTTIFARRGVWLMKHGYKDTPLDFAVNAEKSYWWVPGAGNVFAYNQTGKMVVTTSQHPALIYGSYASKPNKIIHGPENDQPFGIKYPNEKPRLFLHNDFKMDQNTGELLPVIYILDSEQGLVGSL